MKKLLSLLLSVLIVASVFGIMPVSASAESFKESESNDTPSSANKIPANTLVLGNLSNADDVDYYQVNVSKPAKFQIKDFCSRDGSDYWDISVTDSNSKDVIISRLGGMPRVEKLIIRLKAGTYTVKIKNAKDKISWCSENYGFKVMVTYEDSSYEKEDNDGIDSANPIKVNTKIIGNLHSGYEEDGDTDFYKFTLTKSARVNISTAATSIKENYWSYAIYDIKGERIVFAGFGKTNQKSSACRLSAGTYYIQIYHNYYLCTSSVDYAFKVCVTYEGSGFEKENNNSLKTSTAISTNKKITGNLHVDLDVDFYKFTLKTTSTVKLYGYGGNTQNHWLINIYNSKKVSCAKAYFGKTTQCVKSLTLKAGTYYLKVSRASLHKYTFKEYSFKLFTVKASSGLKVSKASKTSVNIKWSKNSDATKYEVYMAKGKGKFKKIATVKAKKLSFVKKSLAKNTTYSFKVRAVDSNGFAGPFSKTVKYKLK